MYDEVEEAPAPAGGMGHGTTDRAPPALAVVEADGTVIFPMEIVAESLRVPIEALLPGMKAGLVYQTTEQGIGEDAGRLRVTFRFRSRQCRLLVEESGRIVPAD